MYVAETSPTNSRPFYLMIYTLFVGLGLMTAAALGMMFHWRVVAAVFCVSCAVGFVVPFFVPATPMWLRSRGRHDEAARAERWFGFALPRPVATMRVATVLQTAVAQTTAAEPDGGRWAAFVGPTVWKPAVLALGFFVCQQTSGFYVLLFYSVDVLRDCRVPVNGMTAAVYLSAARLTGTAFSLLFRSVPKKTLTVISGLGMFGALTTVAGYLYAFRGVADPPGNRLLVAAFLLYVFFAMFAVLPLPWSLCGEIFPMAVKGTMNGLLYSCGYELMFVAIKVYPAMVDAMGIEAVWATFAACCLLTAAFGAFLLPETTGKTLDEITDNFRSTKRPAKRPIVGLP